MCVCARVLGRPGCGYRSLGDALDRLTIHSRRARVSSAEEVKARGARALYIHQSVHLWPGCYVHSPGLAAV
jgi:hypothetical protein